MRRYPVLCAVVAFLGSSCGDAAAARRSHDGTLVLELGGSNPSLREALAGRGIALAAAHRLRDPEPEPAVEPTPTEEPVPQPPADPVAGTDEPVPPAPEVVTPPPAPTTKTVTLKRGQTLIDLAKEHLGNANRFREILAINGWNEARARKLAEGTKVLIPVDRGTRRK